MGKCIMENIELTNKDILEKKYAGFLVRALSGIIDRIIFLLFALIDYTILYFMKNPTKYYYVFSQIIILLFLYIYNVFIPQIHGGTLGKLILKLKILKLNDEKIGFRESLYRYLTNIIYYLYSSIISIIIILNTPNEFFNSFKKFSGWTNNINPAESKFYVIATVLIFIWNISEYIVLLFNKKKRGFQDYFARTIVVNTRYFEIKNDMKTQTAHNRTVTVRR
jgi:uncharacterized RDD family membrane protein YckC